MSKEQKQKWEYVIDYRTNKGVTTETYQNEITAQNRYAKLSREGLEVTIHRFKQSIRKK